MRRKIEGSCGEFYHQPRAPADGAVAAGTADFAAATADCDAKRNGERKGYPDRVQCRWNVSFLLTMCAIKVCSSPGTVFRLSR